MLTGRRSSPDFIDSAARASLFGIQRIDIERLVVQQVGHVVKHVIAGQAG